MTVLVTTHYMDEADQYCDRVALMHRGRVRALGTPESCGPICGNAGGRRARRTRCRRWRTSSGTSRAAASTSREGLPRCPKHPPHRVPRRLTRAARRPADLGLLLVPPRARTGWRVLPARVGAMCMVELQKLRHDRTELYTRAIQPALWLLIFGETFTRLKAIPTGGMPYLDYLAPGIIAQSAMFIAIFYGIQIIWERDAGHAHQAAGHPHPAGRAGHRQGVRGRASRR